MKEGWEIKKLGEICSITDGSHNPPKGVEYSDYRMLSSQNVQNGYLDMDKVRYLSEEDFRNENKRTQAKKGDVLLTIVATIGRTCVLNGYEENITFQRSVAILSPKSGIDSHFIMYNLLSLNSFLNKEANGAAQKGIYLKQLAKVPIGLPPMSEQQRIVDILNAEFEKIDRLRSNAELNLRHAKDLFQAALKEVFAVQERCPSMTIEQTCSFQNGFAFKSTTFTTSGEPILRISDIQNDVVVDNSVVYFNPKSYKEDLSRFKVYPDDILIAMSGGTTGKIGINRTGKTFYLNQRVGVFREKKDVLNHMYLFYYLHTKSDESLKIAAGAAQPNLSTQQIKGFVLPVPSLPEQQTIVKMLDDLNAKCKILQDNYTKTITLCDDLKQSLLRKAFHGELSGETAS